MPTFYLGSKLTWQQYLQVSSFVKDVTGQIQTSSQQEQMAISQQTREIVASNEALAKKFGVGFDSVNNTLDRGFSKIETAIQGATASIDALRASFDYNLALVIEQLQWQSQTLLNFVKQMEAVHHTLQNPILTQARELYRMGCERMAKGLLDKALESFLESAKKDDSNFMTQLMIGKLYLYGVNDTCDVVNLNKAEEHLLAAARYAKAETALLPEASKYAAEALLHASISCYALANEQGKKGNKTDVMRLIQQSLQLASQAIMLNPQLSESYYHHAKFAALIGDGSTAVSSLEKAIALDETYCLKADADQDFRFIGETITQLFQKLRHKSGEDIRRKLQQAEKLVSDWVYLTEESQNARSEMEQLLREARHSLARNTYFDNRDAMQLVQHAEQIFQLQLAHKFALHTVSGHTGRITSLAFSPDASLLASGGADHTIRLWNLAENQLLDTLEGHSDLLTELTFSHNGRMLASVDKRGSVKLWEVTTGALMFELRKSENPVYCIAFSPDDTMLVTGSFQREAILWNTADGSKIRSLNGHKSSVDAAIFSKDGRLIATGSPDNTAIVWEVETGRCLHVFNGCSGLANCLAFTADSSILITGSNDGSVRFYRIADGEMLHALPQLSGTVSWIALNPEGDALATVHYGKALRLWDVVKGQIRHDLRPFSPGITSVRFSPDGTILAGNDFQDRSVKLWNVYDGKLMHVIAGNLTFSAFNPDGTTLVTGDESGSLKFWGRMVTTRQAYEAAQNRKPSEVPLRPRQRVSQPGAGRSGQGASARGIETAKWTEVPSRPQQSRGPQPMPPDSSRTQAEVNAEQSRQKPRRTEEEILEALTRAHEQQRQSQARKEGSKPEPSSSRPRPQAPQASRPIATAPPPPRPAAPSRQAESSRPEPATRPKPAYEPERIIGDLARTEHRDPDTTSREREPVQKTEPWKPTHYASEQMAQARAKSREQQPKPPAPSAETGSRKQEQVRWRSGQPPAQQSREDTKRSSKPPVINIEDSVNPFEGLEILSPDQAPPEPRPADNEVEGFSMDSGLHVRSPREDTEASRSKAGKGGPHAQPPRQEEEIWGLAEPQDTIDLGGRTGAPEGDLLQVGAEGAEGEYDDGFHEGEHLRGALLKYQVQMPDPGPMGSKEKWTEEQKQQMGKNVKPGHCLICGRKVALVARMMGIKLCHKHYF